MRRIPPYFLFILPIIVLSFIWYFSDIPSLKSDFLPIVDFFLRKIAHILEYCILYLSFVLAFRVITLHSSFTLGDILVISAVWVFISALIDEFHQTWVIGREGKFLDIGFDMIGVLTGYIIIFFINYIYLLYKNTD